MSNGNPQYVTGHTPLPGNRSDLFPPSGDSSRYWDGSAQNAVASAVGELLDHTSGHVNLASYSSLVVGGDWAPAFTAAIAAMPNGGELRVPTGTFTVASPVTLVPNLTIRGAGTTATTVRVTGSGAFLAAAPYLLVAKITVADMTIDGSAAAAGAYGIHFKNVDSELVENVWFFSFSPTSKTVWAESDVYDLTVHRCKFENNGGYNIWLGANTGANRIRDCVFDGVVATEAAIWLASGVSTLATSIVGNNFNGNYGNVAIQAGGSQSTTIDSNYCETWAGACVSANTSVATTNLAIINNKFHAWASAAAMLVLNSAGGANDSVTVSNNSFALLGAGGTSALGTILGNTTRVVGRGNKAENGGTLWNRYGVALGAREIDDHHGHVSVLDFGADPTGVADSTTAIQAAIDAAAAAGGGTVRVVGECAVSTPGLVLKTGVTLYSEPGQAERTSHTLSKAATLIATGGVAFDVVTIGTVGNITSAMQAGLKGIAIFNSPGNGIVVHSHAATIEGCSVTDAKGNGIVLNAGTTNVLNTHIIRPGKHGIAVNHGDNRIGAGTEIQQPNNSGAGLTANTYDCINIAANVGGTQIYNVRMGDDFFRSRDAIRLEDTAWDTQITNADFQSFTMAGIRILGGHLISINGNAFWSSSTDGGKVGVVVGTGSQPANNVAITGNTFNGVVAVGIGAISVDTGVTRVSVMGNTYAGLWADAAALVGAGLSGINQTWEPYNFQKDAMFQTSVTIGSANYAQAGALRFPNGSGIRWRNSGNSGDVQALSVGSNAQVGSVSVPLVMATSLATPSGATTDGQCWLEATGTSPTRVCALKMRDGGATRTIASFTY